MGWFGYVPFMETNHGLLSFDHRVNGTITVDGDIHEFNEGYGYMEKDWGESFPSSWIWMQSNSFEERGVSFMLSTAVIPWLGSSFIGHLAVLRVGDVTFNLSTYRGGKIVRLDKSNKSVRICVQSKQYYLDIIANQGESVDLKSPQKGMMTGRTIESLNSTLEITLKNRRISEVIFKGFGQDAGLEIMDDRNEIINGLNLS